VNITTSTSPGTPLVIPDQQGTTSTGNLDIKDELTPRGRLGNTTNTTASRNLFGDTNPAQAHTNQAMAAMDPTRSTMKQTSTRSNRQEEQNYNDAMRDSILDTTTVTLNNNINTSGNKHDQSKVGSNRRSLNQTKIRDNKPPVTACYPRYKECRSVTETILTTWVKEKYLLFNKEIYLHCMADQNKRRALNLMAALVGKTFPRKASQTY
jgi:hypothetical protein